MLKVEVDHVSFEFLKIKLLYKPHNPCTSSLCFATSSTMPNTNGSSFYRIFTTEWACVSGMLSNFHLFDLFSQTSTITCSIFTSNSDFLSSFYLEKQSQQKNKIKKKEKRKKTTHHPELAKKKGSLQSTLPKFCIKEN